VQREWGGVTRGPKSLPQLLLVYGRTGLNHCLCPGMWLLPLVLVGLLLVLVLPMVVVGLLLVLVRPLVMPLVLPGLFLVAVLHLWKVVHRH